MKRIVGVGVLAVGLAAATATVCGDDRPHSGQAVFVRVFAAPRVQIGAGVTVNEREVTATVVSLASDPRGWRTNLDGYTVRVVRAGTEGTRRMPGRIGQANPEQQTVVVSDEAWTELGPRFAATGGTLDDQRAWVVLHELGHMLGHPHQECAGSGPAPVMRETNYQLDGCVFNVWPNP